MTEISVCVFVFSATQIARSDFCIAATSAVAHGFQVNVLGTQRQKQFDEFGPLDKMWALRKFLELLPDHPNVIIAFIDAYGMNRCTEVSFARFQHHADTVEL